MLKRLASVAFSAALLNFFVPQGSYAGFMLVYRGTNIAANNTTLADLGTCLFNRKGNPLVNVPVSVLSALNNEYYGVATFSNTVGAAVFAAVYVPCGAFWDESNIYYLNYQESYFTLQFAELASATGWSAGTVEVYGVEQLGIERYEYQLIDQSDQIGAALSFLPKTITIPNIVNIILTNSNLVSEIQISKDDKLIVNAATDVCVANSDRLHRLETGIANTIVFELMKSKDLREALSTQTKLQFTSTGAGTLQIFVASLLFNSTKRALSVTVANQEIQNQLAKVNNNPSLAGISSGFADVLNG
jgi:hypothetical protein